MFAGIMTAAVIGMYFVIVNIFNEVSPPLILPARIPKFSLTILEGYTTQKGGDGLPKSCHLLLHAVQIYPTNDEHYFSVSICSLSPSGSPFANRATDTMQSLHTHDILLFGICLSLRMNKWWSL